MGLQPLARLLAPLLGSALLACAGSTPAPRPPEAIATEKENINKVRVEAPSLTIRLRPQAEQVGVELVARGLTEMVWELPALAGVALEELTIADDHPLHKMSYQQGREGQLFHITLARAPVGALRIGYTLRPTWDGAVAAEMPPALALRLGRDHLLAASEQLVLLPAVLPVAPIRVDLGATVAGARLVTSLGIEVPPRVRLSELRHAALLMIMAGASGRASFRGPDGEDDFAWVGETRFDLRWSAAETAGVRSAVDAYFGAEPGETARFTGLFAVDLNLPDSAGAVVVPRGGGLYIALAAGARWSAPVRLAIAQGLVHRWLGGRLRLRAGADELPEAGAWFGEGVSRFVAREVLWSLGTLTTDDYAAEVNRHHAELATAPLRRADHLELARAAAAGDRSAHLVMVARGVMIAARLDAAIRIRHAGARSLQTVLRALVAAARTADARALPLTVFTDRIAAEVGEDEVARFRAMLAGGPAAVPAVALGACFSRGPRTYVGHALGFDAVASQAANRIVGLVPAGPAARAGIGEGESLLSLVAGLGDPQEPVEVTLQRGGRAVVVTYRPRGASGRGEAWKRRPGADDQECPH